MKAKLFALAAFAALIMFSGAAQAGSIMGDPNAYMGIRYSPKDFTAAYLSEISIECTGGNTASYTTSEIASVTIFSTIEPAVILLPTTNRMSYFTGAGPSTFEVRGTNFNTYDTFIVAFRDSDVVVEGGTLETINSVVVVNTIEAITTGTIETLNTITNPVTVTGSVTVPNPITAEVKGLVSIEGYSTGEVFPKAGYTTAPTTLTFAGISKSIVVVNCDSVNTLEVEVGWGTIEIDPVMKSRELPYNLSSVLLYALDGTVSAEVEVRY